MIKKLVKIAFIGVFLLNTIVTDAATLTQATININQAQAVELEHVIKGIGIKRAEAIVAYRTKHGTFKSLDELGQVPGIGVRFIQQHQTEIQQKLSLK